MLSGTNTPAYFAVDSMQKKDIFLVPLASLFSPKKKTFWLLAARHFFFLSQNNLLVSNKSTSRKHFFLFEKNTEKPFFSKDHFSNGENVQSLLQN